MTTLNFPVPRAASVQKRNATITDAELQELGVRTPAQRSVFRAIKEGAIKHESGLMRETGLDERATFQALGDLMHMGLIRRGQSPGGLGGLGAFEAVEKR